MGLWDLQGSSNERAMTVAAGMRKSRPIAQVW